VAVVPRTDALKGEVPVAYVVERTSGRTTPEELKAYFLKNGAPFMHPRAITIVTELPLTPVKKTDRAALRKMAEAAGAS
jgi:acyl-coenzyme A synthetase/AMP-(fatty) acid ligase